jgi:hypothetical protein
MRKIFWAPDFRSSQRARQSCSTKCSDTFTGVDALGEQLKPFVGVVSGVKIWQRPHATDDVGAFQLTLTISECGRADAWRLWSLRISLGSEPVYATAALQPFVNFGFAL